CKTYILVLIYDKIKQGKFLFVGQSQTFKNGEDQQEFVFPSLDVLVMVIDITADSLCAEYLLQINSIIQTNYFLQLECW
ncbi:MAG: hypothetical protein ACTSQI_21650, partial [Candidatus Helarchaeota archaeon]